MGDAMRTGIGPSTPAAANPHRTWTTRVDGDVYAEPLVLGSTVIVATERNSVYALNVASGAVHWHVNLGNPVPRSQLECGYIDPNGITSTPVLDRAAGVVYAVAFLNSPMRHELFALNLLDGSAYWHRTVDPPGEDPGHEQQRGSLNLSHGRVYFTYGGFTGDCGNYHGWVIGAPVNGTSALVTWQVPSVNRAAIWAPPGPVIVPSGDVWFASSDSDQRQPTGDWDGNNAVWHFPADLSAPLDSWAPGNWLYLNQQDIDQGSFAPAILTDGFVFDTGKEGIGYLLKQNRLGGIGGQAFKATVCRTGGPTGGSFGGGAVSGDMVFVPCKDGLVALRIDPQKPSFTEVWHGGQLYADTPVLAYGMVWTVTSESGSYQVPWKDGRLWALDPKTGDVKGEIPLGGVPHFASPAAASGHLYIAGLGQVYAISAT